MGERAQRVADGGRLLVDLLQHVMAVFALAGHGARHRRLQDRALDDIARGIVDDRMLARHLDPVAVVQIGDPAGHAGQRNGVGGHEHLAVAIADRQRRAPAGGDQHLVLAAEQDQHGEGALQPRQRRPDRLGRRHSLLQQVGHQMGDDLGVGLALEPALLGQQFGLQLLVVLDDAVMHHGHPVGRVRVGVVLGRAAVGRPAGMADADRAGQRLAGQLAVQIEELALGAAAFDMAVDQGGHARAVIAPIFKPP